MYEPIDWFLLRAPLLKAAEWRRGARALERHPLGPQALTLASPELAKARPGERRERAVDRYGRRAAFRPTPSGLLAGVCVGRLDGKTRVATGTPRAHLAPSWAVVDAAARRLLDDEEVRGRTRLRVAPSVMRGGASVCWIGPGEPFAEVREAELDARLAAILAAADDWCPWPRVRAAVLELEQHGHEGARASEDELDEFLLVLIDEGFLQSELAPPLVGISADGHLAGKLAELGVDGSAVEGELEDAVPSAVLIHQPPTMPTLSRAAVERAAGLVPQLLALQEALAPPASERLAGTALAEALDGITETFGAGALDLAALATGGYGVDLGPAGPADGEIEDEPLGLPPDMGALVAIFDAVSEAQRRGDREVSLDAAAATLPAAVVPPTMELFLVPAPTRAAKAGTGWLLGLHGPAGASLGRFGHALGEPLTRALSDLAAAERRLFPEEERLDVAFSPAPALADLGAHPPTRHRTLALSRWNGATDLAPRDLELVADPAAPEALALRLRGGPVVSPSPLGRVRSATAPAGLARLLVGWSLHRQHAPWALPLGPLAGLAHIPRLTLGGFVVAPASWRLPPATTPAALRRWRRERHIPRFVQVGLTDELLPVDLDEAGAAADLAGYERVHEIWPPVESVVDRDGRRVEAVVMVVDAPDGNAALARAEAATVARAYETIPPPGQLGPAVGWRTFKLFGPGSRRNELLSLVVAAVEGARSVGEIDRWFFLPYVDGPGRRTHLRVRVHAPKGPTAFEARLAEVIRQARAGEALATVETGDYHPERGRFHADELDALHAIFESDSILCATFLGAAKTEEAPDELVLAALAADALTRGLGFDLEARHALAFGRRRAAEATAGVDEEDRQVADAAFRQVSRELRTTLAGDLPSPFAEHLARVAAAARELPAGRSWPLAPTLLHLSAVRLLGPDPIGERLAYTFWQRTLAGLLGPRTRRTR